MPKHCAARAKRQLPKSTRVASQPTMTVPRCFRSRPLGAKQSFGADGKQKLREGCSDYSASTVGYLCQGRPVVLRVLRSDGSQASSRWVVHAIACEIADRTTLQFRDAMEHRHIRWPSRVFARRRRAGGGGYRDKAASSRCYRTRNPSVRPSISDRSLNAHRCSGCRTSAQGSGSYIPSARGLAERVRHRRFGRG